MNRLNQLTWKKSGTSLSTFAYAPYPAGNVHTVAELSGRNVTYGYDNNYRLQNETIASDPAGNNGTEGYTYDNVGNRLTLNSTIPSLSGAVSYSYDPNDRLTTDTYDANGNTVSSSGISYSYDFENRLLMKGAIVVVYDGDGNRVSETVGGATTKFLIDSLNPTRLPQVLDELVNGSVTRTYTYGRQLISENQLMGSTWTPSFYGYDGHGNARFLANAAGTVTDTYTYDAFGAQIASTGTTQNPYLYNGERFDSNLNLYHLRARYYNMLTGRFETMDPVEGKTAHPGTFHKYVYAANNPVNRVDPTGKQVEEEDLIVYEEDAARYVGEEKHHLIQKRFACLLSESAGLMTAALMDGETMHDLYDTLWRDEIAYGKTSCAKTEDVIAAALEVYEEDPAAMQWLEDYYRLEELD